MLANFTKFTEKHLCQSLLFNRVAGLRAATLLKKRLWHRRFSVNFVEFLRTPFLQNSSGRLLFGLVSERFSETVTDDCQISYFGNAVKIEVCFEISLLVWQLSGPLPLKSIQNIIQRTFPNFREEIFPRIDLDGCFEYYFMSYLFCLALA